MPAEETITSLSAIGVRLEPIELSDKTRRLWAQGADPEGVVRTSSIGRPSWVMLKVWSDMRRKTEKLQKKLLAINGVTVMQLLTGLVLLLTIGFLFAAKHMYTLAAAEIRGNACFCVYCRGGKHS
mmetsp:Transcript_57588/g.114316  ORF Transcript_57588/g.114316 Transcript_57588/m.114316 type:complete len:125 (-) Transcript_57588:75-449(-)